MPVIKAFGEISASTGNLLGISEWESAGRKITEYSPTDMLMEAMKPKLPDAPTPEPVVNKGDEGIRRGELKQAATKREIGALYLTRGSRSQDATLGGYTQALGG